MCTIKDANKTTINIISLILTAILAGGLLFYFIVLTGCHAPPPLRPDFCNQSGERSESELVNVTEQLISQDKIKPSEVLNRGYWGFFRTGALVLLTEDKDFIKYFLICLRQYYQTFPTTMTSRDLLDYMLHRSRWKGKVTVILDLLMHNWYAYYDSFNPWSAWDHCAFIMAQDHYWDLLKITPSEIIRLDKKYDGKFQVGLHVSGPMDDYDGYILNSGYYFR